MGQGTKTGQEQGTSIVPGQGQPGTGPGQLNQEPQHQSEHGLQPIPLPVNEKGEHCEPVEQAEQNKTPRAPDDTPAAEQQKDSDERGF